MKKTNKNELLKVVPLVVLFVSFGMLAFLISVILSGTKDVLLFTNMAIYGMICTAALIGYGILRHNYIGIKNEKNKN